MTVYTVYNGDPVQPAIMGIYSSVEKAIAVRNALNKSGWRGCYFLFDHELDALPPGIKLPEPEATAEVTK